ncbi:hypothetical protein PR202_ga22871 [Eleusine coracana subsp. coracana]|uniref:Cullin family profile domain-containing protein n=1 Tax=Eleusine coracana subsp. coracana TaxID=191504 RepID=A0AAV5D524_ELECO|nr:hypothetical protein PR202_ga22871 [Eleusine coracana subsp. coracana]
MARKQSAPAAAAANNGAVAQQGPIVIELDQGWAAMCVGFEKLKSIIAGEVGVFFKSEEYINLYTTVYNMCTQKPPHDYSQQLYEKYQEAFDEYIRNTILPPLKEKHGQFLLRELVHRWKNHKVMVRWLSRFFHYLDRYFISRRSLTPLKEAGWNRFKEGVFNELKETVTGVVIGMVDDERDGQIIDRTILKNVLDMYVELGGSDMLKLYEEDFEVAFLESTADYYSRKAQTWILEDTCPEYMIKAEEYLQKETDRIGNYLHSSTKDKLMKVAQRELLTKHLDQILRKENSGCKVLLCDDKVEDLSRMYRLFSSPNVDGLTPVSKVFKEHVNEQGMSLVQEAIDAAINKKNEKKDTVSALELDFVSKILELHDKYRAYVTDCFQDHPLFHKALKEAFEVVCNKDVAGCTSAELFASYCDSILRKGGIEKLSDEAIEENLDKVVTLLAFISDKDLFVEFHRRLSWIYSLGNCNVLGKFEARDIELIVTTYQAALLLLFNDSERLSYSEIVAQLKLSDDDTVRVLHSLSCAKYKILKKESSALPPSDEKKKVIDDVNKDRRFAIDAALVRIMKSRKIMTHQNLVAECVEQLSRRFKPDIKMMKRRIEDLVTRDYLECDPGAVNSYRYLA